MNIKEKDFGGTPLTLAVEKGHADVVRLLLQDDQVDVKAPSLENGRRVPVGYSAYAARPEVPTCRLRWWRNLPFAARSPVYAHSAVLYQIAYYEWSNDPDDARLKASHVKTRI